MKYSIMENFLDPKLCFSILLYIELFKSYGYSEASIPVIVYWNLRGTETFVVDSS